MRPIRHILVVVDPTSEAQPCMDKAARLARACGAALELFVCDFQSGLLLGNSVPRDVVQAILRDRRVQMDKRLCALMEPLRRTGLTVLADCSFQEQLHAGVIRKARLSGADLVVKDTHYHGAIQRALFTNSDWQLIRECPVPLLLAKPSPWPARVRLAAALDPGHADDKPRSLDAELLAVAEVLAAKLDGEVLAVHAFDPLPLAAAMTSPATGGVNAPLIDVGVIDSLRSFHDAQFKALVAHSPALKERATLIEGSPVMELPGFVAREQVDVLVTGAVSRSPLRRLLLGSTAERLLDRVPCDVLVVKPEAVAPDLPADMRH